MVPDSRRSIRTRPKRKKANRVGTLALPSLQGVGQLKQREKRRQVLIGARMRVGVRWDDVRILNVSQRGLLVQSGEPPSRGTYLEVRRGAQAIVARVVWTDGNRFGVQTQDPLNIEALVSETKAPAEASEASRPPVERRAVPRPPRSTERHERNRWIARAVEFGCIAGFGAGVAALIGNGLIQAFAAPLTATTVALERR